ncbi:MULTISPECIES: helix-turn-helix transcriptional regulator [Mycolicibacterium]|jgi:proteasome accessory factor B|uniref:Helix-turn-helix, type 11 domain protein n=1 Tax=Mycolicibacterium vanbaalenii (strain DSM 7251 / JCM 13017 / BCRC 16820 / KCTC 9966 / NRRL B-24157 / PYR-1) TaxID=350058 RepID=A1T990_MYCVP|nr:MULTISPECIES: WYL domain-containing protein [Mycolicibacterium]ABM13740.1 Helix-turn-helix, type 11 domain protein [Mycolicibacterium vanbaalenii PYR-1]MCV7128828.1 HTH domain-containing protein [Mycolicibacterium vanbaalenii PYR-1]QZT59669.1 WYL domain-containing protein [Mycolicibacterium austroafricanum]QZY43663.1 WYL domain-containing protein [Mycolicibacterium austroafricanum]UJL27399.1 HTH domain-containing protein [Mycolicibacterium vanbaalenii]
MRRAERLYALVDLLRGSRRPLSAARLSQEFEVSKRTIERDIQSLQLAGVPIYADYGVSGGYSILREHSLPPLNLTVPESLAVLAGLALLETSPYGAAARRARAKVLAISREDQLAPVDEALASMFVIDSQSPSEAAVSLIPEAIAARRVVRLVYTSEDGETHTTRDVEAMGLLRGGDSWMFVGWCRLREGIRGFHLDRILHLEITGEVFPGRDPALLATDLSRWRTRRLG